MSIRILIVDDNKDCQTLLHWTLGSYKKCDGAEDGEEALQKFFDAHNRKEPYSVIFLDILMPKKGGLKVIDTIREYESSNGLEQVKIIITTSLDVNTDMRAMLKANCDKLLVKPISLDGINSIVQQVLAA